MTEGTTYGNGWMHKALIALLRHVNIKVFYVFMSVFVIPVTMLFSHGTRLTYRYFRQKKAEGTWRSLYHTYRNHCIFGQTVIDKFAMYAGHQFKLNYHGRELYDRATRSEQPLLQLSAHIGCSEILGYSYPNNKPCNVLVFGGEKASLMLRRQAAFGERNIKMIPVATGTAHSDDIIQAFDNGEIVCAFADRFMNDKKLIASTLHGHQILLAKGPFSMAVNRGLDVFMASAMKERDGSYTAFFTPLSYDKSLPAKQQRQQLADAYMAETERLLKLYPLQWFNYSNAWKEN